MQGSRLRWALVTAIVAVGVLPWVVARPSTQTAGDGSRFGHTNWPFIGGDWTNSRHSTLDQINRSTVATLGTFTYECEEHPWAMGQVFVDS